ncbi:metallophosphoesterase [Virgibacillus sp. 179-BFC.A HS]|uniref:Metallophosphoesterase n=1 Tax=Tigheibacillus jepli TaxID=3035914 RepID=A0ABU5CGN6_9BACI|nr:metallophosphoesterase [Virgibacillus sp. 179-BFC.A HS]MDY0404710.1 metallophosphoesterase [Virgibacillus sp. 179-BFC.A HS]
MSWRHLEKYDTVDHKKVNLEKVDDSHKEKVQKLADFEATNQYDNFRPNENISRGAFATMFYRIYSLYQADLMHTSDTHAHLEDVAKRVTAVKDFRAKYPSALLFDSGDVFSGTLYFNEYHGQADMEFMNLMKYDAMTFGNHEFDLGETDGNHQKLADFISNARFPVLSANVDVSKQPELNGLYKGGITSSPTNGNIYNGMIKNVNGEKIGVFGLTTAETANIASPLNVTFDDYIEKARATVASLEARGADKIIALTHIGYNDNPDINDIKLAKEVDGIDIILGGHSHTKLDQPFLVYEAGKAPTLIDHTYQYGEYLGTLNVKFNDKGEIVGNTGSLVKNC